MLLHIDVQTSAGVSLGSGPITSATDWRSSARLDRAGDFSFTVPMADPQYALLAARVYVRAYELVRGVVVELGQGVVDTIVEDSKANPSMATVSGSDLMRELTWRSVRGLLIAETGYVSPDDVHRVDLDSSGSGAEANPNNYAAYPNMFDGNAGTWQDITTVSKYRLVYIGYSRAFSEVKFTVRTANSTVAASKTRMQYFNGTGWVDLTFATNNWVDGTYTTLTFGQSGSMTFNIPSDWVPLVQNCIATGATTNNNLNDYWVRFLVDPGTYQTVEITEVTLKTNVATLTGAQLIMALAPAGWTLTGYTTTLTSVYLQLGDETILDALNTLTQITGEHFRLSGTGLLRAIKWLRTDATDSGITAWRNGDPSTIAAQATSCLISELRMSHESSDMVSRIVPYGSGQGTARTSLALTTLAAPAGYTLSTSGNYLKKDATEVSYGRVERVVVWSSIGPASSASADQVAAANALFNAALYWLSTHSAVVLSYGLKVHALSGALSVGDTLRVIWLEAASGAAVRSIDANLIVLEVQLNVDSNGTISHNLTVSNVARWPLSEVDAVAQLMGNVRAMSSLSQPLPVAAISTGSVAITVKATASRFGGLNFS